MPKELKVKSLIFVFLLLLLQGCSAIYARLTYDFEKFDHNNQVRFEDGAKDLAKNISADLSNHVVLVASKLYQPFLAIEKLQVYVFSNKIRYAKFSRSSPLTRGSCTKNEIYISSIIRERIETLPKILIHELVHVHLRQYIGTWRYWAEVPGWFHEGLAVEISLGGGAENISDEEGIQSIRSGNHFTPREKSNIRGHKFAHDYGLKPQIYYRQSGLFVRYLMQRDPEAFKRSYLDLIQGIAFSEIWVTNYDKSIPELWTGFIHYVQRIRLD